MVRTVRKFTPWIRTSSVPPLSATMYPGARVADAGPIGAHGFPMFLIVTPIVPERSMTHVYGCTSVYPPKSTSRIMVLFEAPAINSAVFGHVAFVTPIIRSIYRMSAKSVLIQAETLIPNAFSMNVPVV